MNANSESKKTALSYAESYRIVGKRVGEFLDEFLLTQTETFGGERLLLSDSIGKGPYGPCETSVYGFLLDVQNRKRMFKICGIRFGPKQPRPILACLWLQNERRQAGHRKWVLEIFGRAHISFFQEIAEALAKKFAVDVHVRLESESLQYEYSPMSCA